VLWGGSLSLVSFVCKILRSRGRVDLCLTPTKSICNSALHGNHMCRARDLSNNSDGRSVMNG